MSKISLYFYHFFFALKITDTELLFNLLIAFIVFSLSASAIYTLNGCHDIEGDGQHPQKKKRPLGSGVIGKPQAIIIMMFLFMVGFTLITTLPIKAVTILAIYVIMTIVYSFHRKHIAILDVTIIAIGFVLRLFVGSAVTDIHLSRWIIIMTFLLALYYGFGQASGLY